MAMKNPSHPGAGVQDDIDALGLSVAEAAKGIGVTRQQLYRVINGECAITPIATTRRRQFATPWACQCDARLLLSVR